MSIRYFATNRDRENLGRDLDRKTRIELQKGGYHWLDMDAYMAHYLSTTDASSMPGNVIIPNSQQTVFDEFLSAPGVKRIIVCVHGFNVHLHGAHNCFSMMSETLRECEKLGPTLITDPKIRIKGAPERVNDSRLSDPSQNLSAVVGFSWPSDGKVFNYQSDRTEAISSASAFANLITCIRLRNPRAKIHVIAHSMGNFLTCTMLQKLVDQELTPFDGEKIKHLMERRPDPEGFPAQADEFIKQQIIQRNHANRKKEFFVDRYIMLAPDVERRHITQCDVDNVPGTPAEYLGPFYAGLYHLNEQIHHFYSRFDQALIASNIEKNFREMTGDLKAAITRKEDPDNRWEQSLGLTAAPTLSPPNMLSYNAVTLTNREIDHGDYFDSIDIARKIEKIILGADINDD